MIPTDNSWDSLPGNDDGSTVAIPLGFTFYIYGTPYTSVYVNNNGNLSFNAPFGGYQPAGFPSTTAILAGYWTDIDTRTCGTVRYKSFGTYFVASWENVGTFNQVCNAPNTFQIIISNINDGSVGLGANMKFNYGDIQSIGTGSGPATATVGANKGNNIDYSLIGRFDIAGDAYDGGGGNNDGWDYLDYECFTFNIVGSGNTPPSFSGFPNGNVVNISCPTTLNFQTLPPETNQNVVTTVDTAGLCNATAIVSNNGSSINNTALTINPAVCNNGTSTVINFSAIDNGLHYRTSRSTNNHKITDG